MNKISNKQSQADIINQLAEKLGSSKVEAKEVYQTVCEIIRTNLEEGRSTPLTGVGQFYVTKTTDRKCFNPTNNKTFTKKAHKKAMFKMSPKLKNMIAD